MAGILNFSEENRMKIGLINPNNNTVKKGWLGWLASPITSVASPQAQPQRRSSNAGVLPIEGKNFADLWIEFLLKEAENERNTVVNEVPVTGPDQPPTTAQIPTDNNEQNVNNKESK